MLNSEEKEKLRVSFMYSQNLFENIRRTRIFFDRFHHFPFISFFILPVGFLIID